MTLRVTFELSSSDLRHFQRIVKQARDAAKHQDEAGIIGAAESLLKQVEGTAVPDFVKDRLIKLQTLIDMLRDEEWKIPSLERTRVLNALAYFAEPEDLIPDHIPGLGFLDDAIMVELVVRELRHEIEAYEDFCRFREEERKRRAEAQEELTDEALAQKRKALHERMRRRSSRERRRRRSRGGPRISFF